MTRNTFPSQVSRFYDYLNSLFLSSYRRNKFVFEKSWPSDSTLNETFSFSHLTALQLSLFSTCAVADAIKLIDFMLSVFLLLIKVFESFSDFTKKVHHYRRPA